jgi:cell wall-associated NlpC family hydrolase
MQLSLNALLAVAETDGLFVRLASGGFVASRHVAEIGRSALDFVEIAERFVGTPYLWGGRTRFGLDCSGLLQLALHAAGRPCPRDSDMQAAELGEAVLVPDDLEGLQRGDLVFWPGHVGIMADDMMLLHANGYHLTTLVEPVKDAAERILRMTRTSVNAVRRLPQPRETAGGS